MTVQIAPRSLFIVLAVAALVWLAFKLTDFLMVVFFAVLLATAIDQPVSWMQRQRVPRPAAVLAMFAALLGLLVLVVVALVPLVSAESLTLRDDLPGYSKRLESLFGRVSASQQSQSQVSLDKLTAQLSQNLSGVAAQLTTVTVAVGHLLVLLFAMFVLAFFLAADPSLGSRLLNRFAPRPWHDRALAIGGSVRLRIGAWARGQVVIAVTFGLALGVTLWALGVPFAASLGAVAAVLELIPYVGGAVTIILAGLMALSVGLPQLLVLIVVYIVLVNVEAHVLSPVLFGRAVGLPSVSILLALLAGVELLGIVGALLAVPATVIIWAIVEETWPSPNAKAQPKTRWLPAREPERFSNG